MHGEFLGFAILQIDNGSPEFFCRLGDLFTDEEMLKEEIYDEEVGAPSAKHKGLRNAHFCHWPDPFSNVYI